MVSLSELWRCGPAEETQKALLIGQKIRELRVERGLTQRELGRRAGLSHAAISYAEGHKRSPGAETIRRIASALSVDPGLLFAEPTNSKSGAPHPEDVPESLAELLALRGTQTRLLADANLGQSLRNAPVGDVLAASRAVRAEVRAIVPELRRLLQGLEPGSPEHMRVIDFWAEASKQALAIKWFLRARQGHTLKEIVPGEDGASGSGVIGEDVAKKDELAEEEKDLTRIERKLAGVG